MSGSPILAVDLGTQSLRVSALDLDGVRHWSVQRPVETSSDGLRQEQDAGAWRALMLDALREAAGAGIVPSVILVSGPLAGWVLVSDAGEPLAPAVMYNDARTEGDLATVEAALPRGASVPRVTIADPLPQALRLQRQSPSELAAARHLLDATGWLNFVLTGEATLSSYTGIRLYDQATRTRLNLHRVPFGRVVEVGERIATLSTELAEALGWSGAAVVAATFDSKCAYLGSGIAVPGEALDISGTVTSFGVVSAAPIRDAGNRVYAVPFGEAWLVRGSTAAAGSVLEWAREIFGLSVSEIDALIGDTLPTPNDPVFVPYLSGARAPLWTPRARGSVTGLSIATTRVELARALYSGLALSVLHILEAMRSSGVAVNSVRLGGGLARSPVLSQLKADLLGLPVAVLAEHELTTRGLAAIGSTYLGKFPTVLEAAQHMSQLTTTYRPRLASSQAEALLARYLAAAEVAVSAAEQQEDRSTNDRSVA